MVNFFHSSTYSCTSEVIRRMQRTWKDEQPKLSRQEQYYTYLVQLVQGHQVLSSASLHFSSLLPSLPMARCRHVVVLLLLFLQLAALIPASVAAGRGNGEAAVTEVEEEGDGVGAMMRQTLGSRPPSCEGQCRWPCGGRRCEAVQVPITPHDGLPQSSKEEEKQKEATSPVPAAGAGGGGGVLLPSSYYDRSNYKPLGWRCKCLHA